MSTSTLTEKQREWMRTVEKHFGSRIPTINRKQLVEVEEKYPDAPSYRWIVNNRIYRQARGIFTIPWDQLN